jgi:hypothetical protein
VGKRNNNNVMEIEYLILELNPRDCNGSQTHIPTKSTFFCNHNGRELDLVPHTTSSSSSSTTTTTRASLLLDSSMTNC